MISQFFFIFNLFSFLVIDAIATTPDQKIKKDEDIVRFLVKKISTDSSDIVFYFSRPQRKNFPIAILVGGSSQEENVESIIHFHRYFLQKFLDLGIGIITIEQEGVDGNQVNKKKFMEHYTRSNRLSDHRAVIEYIKNHPPLGWNEDLFL